jgi:hypothetical protein
MLFRKKEKALHNRRSSRNIIIRVLAGHGRDENAYILARKSEDNKPL